MCHLEPRGALHVATSQDQAARLKREQKARRDAGLEAPLLPGRIVASEAGIAAVAAIRSREGATLDPYRAAIGLAAAAEERGARLFERSPATRIRFTRRTVDVETADGTLHANRVVVATGVPTTLFKSLVRHFWFRDSFLALTEPVPAKVRRQLGQRASVLRDSATPPHLVRWVDDERLLVAGADKDAVPEKLREKTIVQRTGQLMYELSMLYPDISGVMPAHGWHLTYAATADGLPFIGPHRNHPHHLFAFGGATHSVTGAYLTSRILLRHHLDELDRADEVFGFAREIAR
jgi:glycine/D-amino acid oxidase-like deaminating enzyme